MHLGFYFYFIFFFWVGFLRNKRHFCWSMARNSNTMLKQSILCNYMQTNLVVTPKRPTLQQESPVPVDF